MSTQNPIEPTSPNTPKKGRKAILIIVVVAAVVICLVGLLIAGIILAKRFINPEGSQSKEEAQSTEIVQNDEETCSFICNVNTENYSFGFSCEDSGDVTTEMLGQSTEFVYGPSGNRTGLKISINQQQTYHASQNVYLITGVIELDEVTNSVAYNIQATGGVFGDAPQVCSNSDIAIESPAETEADEIEADEPVEPTEPSSAVPSTEYPTLGDFRETINIEFCDDAMARGEIYGGTYLCVSSEEGDFIGGGEDWLTTSEEAIFTSQSWDSDGNSGTILIEGDQEWGLSLSAPEGTVLIPGIYEDAIRMTSALYTSNNGFSFTGEGRGCNEITGRYEIPEIVRSTTGDLISLAVNFEQHCDGEESGLYGYLRFNAQTP